MILRKEDVKEKSNRLGRRYPNDVETVFVVIRRQWEVCRGNDARVTVEITATLFSCINNCIFIIKKLKRYFNADYLITN